MLWCKSRAAADQLHVSYWQLFNLLRTNQLQPPAKDTSGDFVWMPEDIERARLTLAARRAKRKAVPA
jgi:hypothetical protein